MTKKTKSRKPAPTPDLGAAAYTPTPGTSPQIAIMDILQADRLDSERRESARAYDECLVVQERMRHTKAKTLTGSLLEALGLGRPDRQGGRATAIQPVRDSVGHKTKLSQPV